MGFQTAIDDGEMGCRAEVMVHDLTEIHIGPKELDL